MTGRRVCPDRSESQQVARAVLPCVETRFSFLGRFEARTSIVLQAPAITSSRETCEPLGQRRPIIRTDSPGPFLATLTWADRVHDASVLHGREGITMGGT